MSTQPQAIAPAVLPESPLVSNAKLRQIYTLMLHCRAAESQVRALVAHNLVAGEMVASLAPGAAEAAMLAATAVDLGPRDTLLCARRDWLPAIFKGVPLAKVARFLLAGAGARALSDSAHGLNALPARPESQLEKAIEAAVAQKRRKGTLALAYIAGSASYAAWQQALLLAAGRCLPLVLVCRTGSAFASDDAAQQAVDFSALASASEVPHIHVDGGDALAIYRVAQESTGRARRRIGPALIECRIEKNAVVDESFAAMERHLAAKGVFTPAWQQETESAFARQFEAALFSARRRADSHSQAAVRA
jgi:TPP-dependent pyruvate/acetoin dehydrogenase alpha subunit